MNIFTFLYEKIQTAITKIHEEYSYKSDLNLERVVVESPKDPRHGDLSTNAALVLAGQLGLKPRELAEKIRTILADDADLQSVEIAGAGFINFRFSNTIWQNVLRDILVHGVNYGRGQKKNVKVNVEYVSANPTGPLHVAHSRVAVVGDVLANLLSYAGYDVTKEFYINDAGNQVDILAKTVMLRYREALGEEIGEIPAGLYPGQYLIKIGEDLVGKYGNSLLDMSLNEALDLAKDFAIEQIMIMIKQDLMRLGVTYDVFFAERELHKNSAADIQNALNELTTKGYVYTGKLLPPKGCEVEEWEDREQLLFCSTKVGDDMDRPITKADGSYSYFASDIAYFKNKYTRGFDKMLYVLGADHSGYVKRLQAISQAFTGSIDAVEVLLCQLVKILRNGQVFKMSKRAGEFVTLSDLLNEVGKDPIRFTMVYRHTDVALDFDLQKVTEQTKDNPVFYVQYAHARCVSILRQAKELLEIGEADLEINSLCDYLDLLGDPAEIELILKLAQYSQIIEIAARQSEPHKLAFYLYDLAASFHSYWNKGNDNPQLRFIIADNKQLTLARLALLKAIQFILQSGIGIIGIDAPDKM